MPGPTNTQRLETLRSIPMFAELSDRSLKRIRALSDEVEVPAGQLLVQPRQAGSGLFIIEEGTVLVEPRGQKIELGPGQFFGEIALLSSHPHTARVRAKTALRCLAINRFNFRKLLESEPKIAISMLETMASRFAGSILH